MALQQHVRRQAYEDSMSEIATAPQEDMASLKAEALEALTVPTQTLSFTGSAGQGFGVFLVEGLHVRLYGEANDSVGKGMSGGTLVILPHPDATFSPEKNSIIGNCALYGATGGCFYAYGVAGDRFAVRNSGALAVVEGTGLHACEYMTNGVVVVLGTISSNLGAGMTGGTVYLYGEQDENINPYYLAKDAMLSEEIAQLKGYVAAYHQETQSSKAGRILEQWNVTQHRFCKYIPHPTTL